MRPLAHRRLLLLIVSAVLVALITVQAQAEEAQAEEAQAEEAQAEEAQAEEAQAEEAREKGARRILQPSTRKQTYPPGLAEVRLVKEKAEEIGVNEETLNKVDALMTEIKEQEEELRAKTVESSNKLRTLMDENLPTEEAVMAAADAAAKLGWETRQLRLRASLRVRALLTKEQLEKFMDIRKKATTGSRRRGARPRP